MKTKMKTKLRFCVFIFLIFWDFIHLERATDDDIQTYNKANNNSHTQEYLLFWYLIFFIFLRFHLQWQMTTHRHIIKQTTTPTHNNIWYFEIWDFLYFRLNVTIKDKHVSYIYIWQIVTKICDDFWGVAGRRLKDSSAGDWGLAWASQGKHTALMCALRVYIWFML